MLYANWGSSPLIDIRDNSSQSTRAFQLAPDPATHETSILFRFERNPNDPKWGTLKIETGAGASIITIDSDTTALLMGDIPSRSEAVGDNPVTRGAMSPITLFAIESTANSKLAFCLWLDQPIPQDGG
ncbi:hypothetical protein [Rubripirellula tenax]|nr:hypothetical protein [Rubripirellula tenax]